MSDTVQIQYDAMEQIRQLLARLTEQNSQMLKNLQSAYQPLESGDWEGKGAGAFFNTMQSSIFPSMQRLIDGLGVTADVSQQISQIFQNAEQEAAAIFKGDGDFGSGDGGGGGGGLGALWNKASDWVHGALDVVGFIPGLGEIADGANALIYLAEGRYLEAGISAAAMIPLVGDAGKIGKYGVKVGKEIVEEGIEKGLKEGAEAGIEKGLKEGAEGVGEKGADVVVGPNGHIITRKGIEFNPDGSFNIRDWSDYPTVGDVPIPKGPFRILEGEEYDLAREAANKANRKLHREHPEWKGMDIHEFQPVKFGGSPTDIDNKIAIPRSVHSKYTTWWNQLQKDLGY